MGNQNVIIANLNDIDKKVEIFSHEECLANKKSYASNFKIIEKESNKIQGRRILQGVKGKTLVINPVFPTMTEIEIDASYDLPYTRLPHPKYTKRGPIPAYEMIKFSINIHRGCFGGCSFCSSNNIWKRMYRKRSVDNVIEELKLLIKN